MLQILPPILVPCVCLVAPILFMALTFIVVTKPNMDAALTKNFR